MSSENRQPFCIGFNVLICTIIYDIISTKCKVKRTYLIHTDCHVVGDIATNQYLDYIFANISFKNQLIGPWGICGNNMNYVIPVFVLRIKFMSITA